jgi:hypothetical protein
MTAVSTDYAASISAPTADWKKQLQGSVLAVWQEIREAYS